MIFTGDTVAKAHVLNKEVLMDTLDDGCPYCLHKGTIVNKHIRYCQRDNGLPRNNQQTRTDMIAAFNENRRVNGYHGVSALIALNEFDVVWQVGIDKMHNIDLGVIKHMFKLFLDPKFREKGITHVKI